MKHLFNHLSQEDKQKILELYYTNKNSLNEQRFLSGIKQGVKGFGAKVNAKFSNLKNMKDGGFKSPQLEKDLAQVKSRSKDLSKSIGPFLDEVQNLKDRLEKNDKLYGANFQNAQKKLIEKVNLLFNQTFNLKKQLDNMEQFNVYESQKTQGNQQKSEENDNSGDVSTDNNS